MKCLNIILYEWKKNVHITIFKTTWFFDDSIFALFFLPYKDPWSKLYLIQWCYINSNTNLSIYDEYYTVLEWEKNNHQLGYPQSFYK